MSHLPWRVGMKKVMERAVAPSARVGSWKIVKGDTVEITAGIDKGQRGTVLEVHRRWNTMLVGGCRLNKKRANGPNGEKTFLYELEAPVHYAHVHLVDPNDDAPCTVSYKWTEEGKRVRVSDRTGTVIPTPKVPRKDWDNKWTDYKEGPKDTRNAELLLRTYFPIHAATFEDEITGGLSAPEEFNYPPKGLAHMRRNRYNYPSIKKEFEDHWEWTHEYRTQENLEKAYDDTVANIENLKAKDLDEVEKQRIRDAQVASRAAAADSSSTSSE